MPTILDTINEIEIFQKEVVSNGTEDKFVEELMNFTTIIYFDYLSHAVLDAAKNKIDLTQVKGAIKYYELYKKEGLLGEYVRIDNIGRFSVIWNTYEKYLRNKHLDIINNKSYKISEIFNDLIEKIKPDNQAILREEFDVMRHTRNSLHDGGKYSSKFTNFEGVLCGTKYKFLPGIQVMPLRVMDVVQTMWVHYKRLEALI